MASQFKVEKVLYLGLDPSRCTLEGEVTHYPIILIKSRSLDEISPYLKNWENSTHVICTSRTAVALLFDYQLHRNHFTYLAIGTATAALLKAKGVKNVILCEKETAEGMVALLKQEHQCNNYYFYPHSAISRPIIKQFLIKQAWNFIDCILYDTIPNIDHAKVDLACFDTIVFTSPSTVDAFYKIFGNIPYQKKLIAIGEITQDYLKKML